MSRVQLKQHRQDERRGEDWREMEELKRELMRCRVSEGTKVIGEGIPM